MSSDAALVPDAKRKKSLDTQRAFRARKAAHVKHLEVKVALQELEIARLKRENQALHADIARLAEGNGATPTVDATPCSVAAGKGHAKIHDVQMKKLPAVLQHSPSVLNHVVPSSPVCTLPHGTVAPHLPKCTLQLGSGSYSTSALPVFTGSAHSGTPALRSTASTATRSPDLPSLDSQCPLPILPSASPGNASLTSGASIPGTSATEIARVVCCNGMFTCDDENGADITLSKDNSSLHGIGGNTIDDFYALFGGSGLDAVATDGQLAA